MKESITVPLSEVKEVFDLLEDINHLFHQPLYYQDKETVDKFAEEKYQTIKRLYYDVTWDWLPKDVQKDYEKR